MSFQMYGTDSFKAIPIFFFSILSYLAICEIVHFMYLNKIAKFLIVPKNIQIQYVLADVNNLK